MKNRSWVIKMPNFGLFTIFLRLKFWQWPQRDHISSIVTCFWHVYRNTSCLPTVDNVKLSANNVLIIFIVDIFFLYKDRYKTLTFWQDLNINAFSCHNLIMIPFDMNRLQYRMHFIHGDCQLTDRSTKITWLKCCNSYQPCSVLVIEPYALMYSINSFRAKFFRGNINIYLHFMSLLHTDMTQVLKILPHVRPGPTYST